MKVIKVGEDVVATVIFKDKTIDVKFVDNNADKIKQGAEVFKGELEKILGDNAKSAKLTIKDKDFILGELDVAQLANHLLEGKTPDEFKDTLSFEFNAKFTYNDEEVELTGKTVTFSLAK